MKYKAIIYDAFEVDRGLQYYHINLLIHSLTWRKHIPILSSFTTYHRVCNQINTTGATSGAGTTYPSRAHEFTPGFQWGSCYSTLSFMCMFCRSLFVILYFFLWPLYCLFFFDLMNLITPYVSSNSFFPQSFLVFFSTRHTLYSHNAKRLKIPKG